MSRHPSHLVVLINRQIISLFGVLCVQCYMFFQKSHGETVFVKISVALMPPQNIS